MQAQLLKPNLFLIAGFFLCGLLANVAVWKIVSEVNARLPEAERFSWFWWTLGKHMRLWRAHKRLCPESSLRRILVLAFSAGILLMFLIVFFASKVPT